MNNPSDSVLQDPRTPSTARSRGLLHYVRKLREHGILRILKHLSKRHARPAYVALRRLETSYVRLRDRPRIRRRRAAAAAALRSEWTGFIPRDTGARIVAPGTIPGADEVRAYCSALWRAKAQAARARAQTYTSLFASDISAFDRGEVADLTDHGLVQAFATSPAMTAIVCDYLGEMPVIRDLNLSVTHSNETVEGSQQFHVDFAPRPHVKFYLAIEDITEDCGPLTWIDAAESRRIRRRERHHFGRLPDAALAGAATQRLLGPAGTAAFVDTSRCLHFGSRGNRRERVSLIIFYDPIGNRGTKPYPTSVRLLPAPGAELLTGP